jgi:hypothetical protein
MTNITFWHSHKALTTIFFTWHCGVQHTTYISSVQRLHLNPGPYASPPTPHYPKVVWEYIIHNTMWQGQTMRWGSHSILSWEKTVSNNSISLPLCASHPPFFALLPFSSSFCQFPVISSLNIYICPPSRPCTQFPSLLPSLSPYSLYPADRGGRYLSIRLKDHSLKVILTPELCWNATLLLAT